MKLYRARRWIHQKRKRRIRKYSRLRRRRKGGARWLLMFFIFAVCGLLVRAVHKGGAFALPFISRFAELEQVEEEEASPFPMINEGFRLRIRDGTLELFRLREEYRQEEAETESAMSQ